ncbi:UDP-N-acetylglucosamine 2-epimerase BpsF (plasmid) [Bacillus tropicus]|uniref:UDP-N-acetylglucosamine 2-epimerase BpsF n=1 Tax=Bacillus TaxID=1386 RepID=UPI0010367C3A|nr:MULTISPECIES: UDP-N-acetylglucosamine 2-epimerase BpsF [Bacillus]WBO93057.1 UDP-N-acetylglucosamine 2-epimerase BpsF [Bacillus tropicus]
MKKILFLTGTRADYGKIKSLMWKVQESDKFDLHIFVTGMHNLSKYGSTWREIEKDGFKNLHYFINQKSESCMDMALSNTILGLSNYVHELNPDMIVIHGDRLESLAGAIVGAFNNIKVAHIEGGEKSGTIDESIRHAITKFSHIHLVSNEEAKKRIKQLGELEKNIYIIGSPDIDIMLSENLPTIEKVKSRYGINFEKYSILMYHPVTTEINRVEENIKNVVDAVKAVKDNYIVIYPNNDEGSSIILNEFKRFNGDSKIRLFPSMKFEYFLTLLKHSQYMIGNSSAGIRETGVYGVPSVDIGNRQKGRYCMNELANIIHTQEDKDKIVNSIEILKNKDKYTLKMEKGFFGNGKSDKKFIELLESKKIWEIEIQKKFIDVVY